MINRILLFSILMGYIGCTQKQEYNAIFYSKKEKIFVESGNFYITENGSPYFYINNKEHTNIISNIILDSIEFSLNNKIYTAKPIRVSYSDRDKILSNFFFPVDNKSSKIIMDNYNGKEMFTLAQNKTDIIELINPEMIKDN